jgi:flagellar biosynthesis regulator FlbT
MADLDPKMQTFLFDKIEELQQVFFGLDDQTKTSLFQTFFVMMMLQLVDDENVDKFFESLQRCTKMSLQAVKLKRSSLEPTPSGPP